MIKISRYTCIGQVLHVFLLLFIFIAIIPGLLNYFLQKESFISSVIGGDEAPRIWLSFWGSYLAAIGSVIAASVALCNERKNRKRDYFQHRLSELRGQYALVEKEVMDLLEVHSLYQLTGIVRAYGDDGVMAARDKQEVLFSKLKYALIPGERYHDNKYSPEFIQALKSSNIFFLDKALEARELIEKDQNDSDNKSLQSWIERVSKEWDESSNKNDLFYAGLDLLHNLREEINKLESELQSVACRYEKSK